MSQESTLPIALSAGSLSDYFQSVNSIPMLSEKEERELAARYREFGDLDAARQLTLSHLRFVVKVARGYSGYGLSQLDLIQEGNIGLMKAVKRFDTSFGVRLVSFAIHWIRAEIQEYILRNWRIVKIATTKAQRKLFFKLRSAKKKLAWLKHDEASVVAEDMGVKLAEVLEMENRLSGQDISFDAPETDNEESSFAPIDFLESHDKRPDEILEINQLQDQQQIALQSALLTLDERSKDIIKKRWLTDKKQTLHQLADKYGVSAERIRQLEKIAFKKIAHSIGN